MPGTPQLPLQTLQARQEELAELTVLGTSPGQPDAGQACAPHLSGVLCGSCTQPAIQGLPPRDFPGSSGLVQPLLPWDKIPVSPSPAVGRDSWENQEPVDRAAAVNLETTALLHLCSVSSRASAWCTDGLGGAGVLDDGALWSPCRARLPASSWGLTPVLELRR